MNIIMSKSKIISNIKNQRKCTNTREDIHTYACTYLLEYIAVFAHVTEEKSVQINIERNGHLKVV
jgi:hypothetical protein